MALLSFLVLLMLGVALAIRLPKDTRHAFNKVYGNAVVVCLLFTTVVDLAIEIGLLYLAYRLWVE